MIRKNVSVFGIHYAIQHTERPVHVSLNDWFRRLSEIDIRSNPQLMAANLAKTLRGGVGGG